MAICGGPKSNDGFPFGLTLSHPAKPGTEPQKRRPSHRREGVAGNSPVTRDHAELAATRQYQATTNGQQLSATTTNSQQHDMSSNTQLRPLHASAVSTIHISRERERDRELDAFYIRTYVYGNNVTTTL